VKRARRPIVVKRLDRADEERRFEKGRFRLVKVGGAEVGRAEYEPGWRWSTHVGPIAGTPTCRVEHVGLVISGRAAVKMDDGEEVVLGPGDVFYVPPGHDSWVVGEEPYVSLHLQGASSYAARHAARPRPPSRPRGKPTARAKAKRTVKGRSKGRPRRRRAG
jgi:mannose-6-phosphate isomerase-like protein (cupin superfamily)